MDHIDELNSNLINEPDKLLVLEENGYLSDTNKKIVNNMSLGLSGKNTIDTNKITNNLYDINDRMISLEIKDDKDKELNYK